METVDQSSCSLMLVVEAAGADRQLEAVLACGPLASVCIRLPAGREPDGRSLRDLIGAVQKAGAAALIVDDPALAKSLSADGVHLSASRTGGTYAEARAVLGSGRIVGAEAGRSRDAAMHLGEEGADYVGFGIPDFVTDRETAWGRRLDLVRWWAEIFEIPCVAFDVESAEHAAELAAVGVDFVAMRLDAALSAADARSVVAEMHAAIAGQDR